jgi:hypothetical protein
VKLQFSDFCPRNPLQISTKKDIKMENKLSSSPALHPPIAPEGWSVSKEISFDLRTRDPTKIQFFLRHFLTKILWRGEALQDWERIAIEYLAEKYSSIRDPYFISKYQEYWLSIPLLMKIYRDQAQENSWAKNSLILLQKNCKVFLSPRAFLGRSPSLKEVLKRLNRKLRKNPKPPNFIGVGYRDKGSAQQSHLDGTPSWEDVVAGSSAEERKKLLEEGLIVFSERRRSMLCIELNQVPFQGTKIVVVP